MADQPHAYLEWLSQSDQPPIVLSSSTVCRFGRDANSTVVLADELVSRNHAFIEQRGDAKYFLSDHGSRNGTYLNGAPIRGPRRLADGDLIGVGQHMFVFHQPGAPQTLSHVITSEPTIAQISVEVITVLVMDVQGFTDWSRALGPERTTVIMSALFREADTILRRHGVWAQKYVGDAVMAIWPHRSARRREVVDSVLRSAVEVFDALGQINAEANLEPPLHMGAGINTGPASIGNIGTDGNADYTALGDSVNKAFRLESATRQDDCDLMIGDGTFQLLDSELRARVFVPRTLTLKGYPDPVPAWAACVADVAHSLGVDPSPLTIGDDLLLS